MSGDEKFCARCGAIIPEGSLFCGECGLSLNQEQPESTYSAGNPIGIKTKKLGAVPACIILYGIAMSVFSLIGLYLFLNFDSLINMLSDMASQLTGDEQKQIMNMITELRNTYTADVRALGTIECGILLISGLSAILSGYYANKEEKWKFTLTLCAIATALSVATAGLLTIVFVAVGAYMTYRIYQAKDLFKS